MLFFIDGGREYMLRCKVQSLRGKLVSKAREGKERVKEGIKKSRAHCWGLPVSPTISWPKGIVMVQVSVLYYTNSLV